MPCRNDSIILTPLPSAVRCTDNSYVDGLRGPIIIQPAADVTRPWSAIDNSSYNSLEEAYTQAVPLMLHEWRHETFDNALVRYRSTGKDPYCSDTMLINSQGRVKCLPASTLKNMAGTAASFGLQDYLDPTGCVPPVASFLDQLANENARTCSNTTSAYGVYPTSSFGSSDGKWAAFHLINAGGEWQSCFSIDGHDLWIVARDANFVQPQKVQVVELVLGARYTVIVPTNVSSQGQYRIRLAACGNLPQLSMGYAVLNVDKASSSAPSQPSSAESAALSFSGRDLSRSTAAVSKRQEATPEPASVSTVTQYPSSVASTLNLPPEIIGFPVPSAQPYKPSPSEVADLPLQQAKWSNGFPQADTPAGRALGWTVTNDLPSQGTVYLHYNGSVINGGLQQNESALAPFTSSPPPQGAADYTFHLALNMTNVVTWSMVGLNKTLSSLNFQGQPVLFERVAVSQLGTSLPSSTLLEVRNGSVVDFIFQDVTTALGPNPGHPIHKHNDQVWFLGSGSGTLNYSDVSAILASPNASTLVNMRTPERVDSWAVPSLGWSIVRHIVRRPSITLMHCHIAQHLSAAMAVVLVEAPELLNSTAISPLNLHAPHVIPPYVPANGIVGLSEL